MGPRPGVVLGPRAGPFARCGRGGGGVSVPGVLPTTTHPPAPAVPHPEGVSNDEFRAAMSRLTAGVVLVTAHDPDEGPRGEDVGMTATAFMSVSLDPPLVLVSLRNGSRMDDLLAEQPLWGVSILSDGQRQIAGRFAMKGRVSDRLLFADITTTRGEASGALLVGGSLATLECRTEQRVVAGDHTLVIARVLSVAFPSTDGAPLTYFKGNYRHLS
ncbi:reductase [Streptomyces sp. CB03238]|nr:reductase [Streptomyces sp. CB03238]